jgi:hypothetical protein
MQRPTNGSNGLGYGYRKCPSNNLAHEIQPDLTSTYFEKWFIRPNESLLAEEKE